MYFRKDRRLDMKQISASYIENERYLDELLKIGQSFDIIKRKLKIGGHQAFFYFVDGFTKDDAMLKLMDGFFSVEETDFPENADAFIQTVVSYAETEEIKDYDSVVKNLMSGPAFVWMDMTVVLELTVEPIPQEAWKNRRRISPCGAPEMDLWRRSYSIRH